MEMNTQRLMSAFLLTGLLAAPALAFEVKPGEWAEEINVSGKAMIQGKVCISPEQAKNVVPPSAQRINQNSPEDCKINARESKGVVSVEMKCDELGLKMESTIRSVGANEIQTEMAGTTTMPGGKPPMTMVAKDVMRKISDTEVVMISWVTVTSGFSPGTDRTIVSYKYLGPVCGKDAEPLDTMRNQ